MDIIADVFKRTKAIPSKLKAYGFVVDKRKLVYVKKLMDENFEARLSVDKNGKISGKVYDLDMDEEYTNIYSDSQYGAFVSQIRNAYIELLEDIREKCFEKEEFLFSQTKRIVSYIGKQYGSKPEYLWKRYPGYAVFRDRKSGKWFAIIMNVDGSKIGLDKKEYEVIDLHLDPNMVASLKGEKGFHEAYHMDKNNWITILLDESIDDEIIASLIEYSFDQAQQSSAWIVPANPKYYDIVGSFEHSDSIIWKQSSDVHVGDIVYLYVAEPYSAVLFKCMAAETDIPYEYKDKNVSMYKVMRLSLLKRFPKDKYTFRYLNSLGIKTIRGPRRLKKEAADQLD